VDEDKEAIIEVWSSKLAHSKEHIELLTKQLISENKRVAHLLQENSRVRAQLEDKSIGE
jgi:hypothetical protein